VDEKSDSSNILLAFGCLNGDHTQMSSLAITSENHVEPSSEDSCHDSTISRPRYVVLQALVGIMLAYQLLSGAELIASRPTIGVIVVGLVALGLWRFGALPGSPGSATYDSSAALPSLDNTGSALAPNPGTSAAGFGSPNTNTGTTPSLNSGG